jgi:hypothetical protein
MRPYSVDPSWFADRWDAERDDAQRLQRTTGLISLVLSCALVAVALVVLRHLVVYGA